MKHWDSILVILLALHFAIMPAVYGMLGIILIVAMEAQAITAWVWFPYAGCVAITALIIRFGEHIAL